MNFKKHVDDLTAYHAAGESKRLALPQKPDDYKLSTSSAFKAPEGIEFKIQEDNPLWPQARAWAQKHQLSQDGFSEALDLFAGFQVSTQQAIKGAYDAEVGKLGATGPARMTAINQWLDAKGLSPLKTMLVTAEIAQTFEKLITQIGQGGTSFSQQHRDQSTDTFNEAEYQKLPIGSARLEYMQKHGRKPQAAA